jgi:RNA polymerase sigma-70 factor (ECF subfamily)
MQNKPNFPKRKNNCNLSPGKGLQEYTTTSDLVKTNPIKPNFKPACQKVGKSGIFLYFAINGLVKASEILEKHLIMADIDELSQIVGGCQRGDAESFSQLVDLYSRRCYGFFYRLTGNRALSEDLLSELFVKLVEKIGSFRGERFENWLFRVARNIFHDYLRKRQREVGMLERQELELALGAREEKSAGKEVIDRLEAGLKGLDEDTRELIMLRYYSQMSFKELAELRGEPIGTTLAKVHRGIKRLGKLME